MAKPGEKFGLAMPYRRCVRKVKCHANCTSCALVFGII